MTTISQILDKHRIPIAGEGHKHYRQGWVNICCPFCGDETFHLGIRTDFHYGNCYKCGPKNLAEIYHRLFKCDWREAKELVTKTKKYQSFSKDTRRTGNYSPPKNRVPLCDSKKHVEYLKRRRIDIKQADQLWKIEAIKQTTDQFRWRLFIPFYFHNEPVSWTTRAIGDVEPRYRNAKPTEEKFSAKAFLFGEDFVGDTILIHEGPLDAITIGPGATSTNGIQYTTQQFNRMIRYPKRYLCFDNEPLAQRRAMILCEQLKAFPGKTYNIVIDAKDINDASDRERAIVRRSVFKGK